MARMTISEQLREAQEELKRLEEDFAALNKRHEHMQASYEATIASLKTLNADHEAALKVNHEKELKSVKDSQAYYSREAEARGHELEQAHAVLDGVEGAPSREYEGDYGKLRRNVVTRLAGAFLAIARNGGVK